MIYKLIRVAEKIIDGTKDVPASDDIITIYDPELDFWFDPAPFPSTIEIFDKYISGKEVKTYE